MYSTYHFSSAQELSADIVDAIKAAYKTKAITIIVEEDDETGNLTDTQRAILDDRLNEDESSYLTAQESVSRLKKKHGL